MDQSHAQQAHGVAEFTSVTAYPPGEKPVKFEGEKILAAGVDPNAGVIVLVALDEEGRQIQFFGVPLKIIKRPMGVVAPGGLIVPPGRPRVA